MAKCLECHQQMYQTQAVCPKCGHDYQDETPCWQDLLLRRSSVKDLLLLVTILGVPFALLSHLLPILVPSGRQQLNSAHFAYSIFLFGLCFYFCGWALHKAAPIWARFFNIAGILALSTWWVFLA